MESIRALVTRGRDRLIIKRYTMFSQNCDDCQLVEHTFPDASDDKPACGQVSVLGFVPFPLGELAIR